MTGHGDGRRCAVLGKPIAHSLSPVLHRAAYQAVGLGWSYDAHEVDATGLPAFLDGLDPIWRGLSLTMPLKRAAIPLIDEISDRAEQARAVNTLLLEDGRRVGHNTDIPGVAAAIRQLLGRPVASAVILGGGATATSTLLALADLGCPSVTLVVRDPQRAADALAAASRHPARPEVRVRPFTDPPAAADLLISTIPADAQPELALPLTGDVPAIFDVLYDPWPTPLARLARAEDRALVGGLDLLVHQAVGQFTLMTGIAEAPVAAMRAAGEQALARRGAAT